VRFHLPRVLGDEYFGERRDPAIVEGRQAIVGYCPRARSAMNRRQFGQLTLGAALATTTPEGLGPTAPSANPFRLSFMLWALEKQAPLERCIEIVAAAGYQGVQLVGEFQKWSKEDARRITARMRALGLVVDAMSGVNAGFANPNESNEFKTQLAAQISAARELECPQIILLSGKQVDGLNAAQQRLTAIENLKSAGDLAAKNNLQIVIEPVDPLENPTIFLSTVSEAFAIARELGSPSVKVLYDFYHEQRAFGNLIEKLEKNIEWVGLVHVADVPGRHEPGTGEIDYPNIYRKLAELKYDKFIAMEYYPTGDPIDSLRAARLGVYQAVRTSRPSSQKTGDGSN
jgi:hydroxypyruvate isomerase